MGESTGREEELTIVPVVNDIRAAVDHVCDALSWSGPVHLVSASFSGGAMAMYAVRRPAAVGRLVLLNPEVGLSRAVYDFAAGLVR